MITYDGVSYQYNGENRLTSVQPLAPAENDTKVTFIYDFLGRRVQKTTYAYRAGTWAEQSTKTFVYDGWHLIAELDEAGEVTRYFVWGLDLSQTLQGAGGVGGLICAVDSSSGSSQTYQYFYDGNGNVGQVVNSTDGAIVASYAYDPFGKTIKADGVYATENKFKFSTKIHEEARGLIYYVNRYYSPKFGRWTQRDPIDERDERNLYLFLSNDSIDKYDLLGLCGNEINNEERPYDIPEVKPWPAVKAHMDRYFNPETKNRSKEGVCRPNTCDRWQLTIVSVVAVGAKASGMAIKTELRPDPECCMDDFLYDYSFYGGGIGVGYKKSSGSISIDTSVKWFDTPCIKWEEHEGFGRATSAGVGGANLLWGVLWLKTPYLYERFFGKSTGFDFSMVTSVGYWNLASTPSGSHPGSKYRP
ncbi:MAG: hypothetical protein CSA22_00015 [Deltaproteobacteria bacterium]|nr:MAG: hypothetical protein CSA22_00015 [Deltaproteobacteria bacterium]